MKILLQKILLPLFLMAIQFVEAQNIGIGTNSPHTSAKLEVQSQNSGVLLPRMNSLQRKAISNPAAGLILFDTDKNCFMYWSGTEWQALVPANSSNGKPAEVTNPGNPDINNFGYEVAVSGNFAAIAAMNNAGGRLVYIYEKTSGGWLQRQQITCPDAGGAYFGGSLDMDGDCLVIGDYLWKNVVGTSVGKVFIYKRNNSIFSLEAGLQSIATEEGHFGYDVAVSQSSPGGMTIAIGMPRGDGTAPARFNSGKVLLYRKVNNNWVISQNVQPAEMLMNDHTGFSVDIDGPVLVFGAPFRNEYGGGAYIYEYNTAAAAWQLSSTYSGSGTGGLLGHSVSVSGTWVAVGRPTYTAGSNGSVLLYKKNSSGTWTNRWLNEPNGLAGETRTIFFGKAVKLEGENMLVGAASSSLSMGSNFRYGNENGKAILYKLRFTGLTNIQTSVQRVFQAEFSYYNDYFAESIGLSQGNIILGHQHRAEAANTIRGAVLFSSYDE